MTAIIAHANDRTAFVAGDSKRAGCLFPVCKVYAWSDSIVFGQAGHSRSLNELVSAMLFIHRGVHGDSLDDMRNAISLHHAPAMAAANNPAKSGNTPVGGELLIAVAGGQAGGGELWIADVVTGTTRQIMQQVAGIGSPHSDPVAQQTWAAGPPPSALDLWAGECFGQIRDPNVAFPIDLLIGRPRASKRAIVRRRFAAAPRRRDKLFAA